MESHQPNLTSAPALEKELPRKAIPNPNSVYGVFEYYTTMGSERDPEYTLDQQRDLLTSIDFTNRVASTRRLLVSFESQSDIHDEGTARPPELTPTKLNAAIAGFIDEYAQEQNLERKEGEMSRLQLDLQYNSKDVISKMIKQLEGQNFRPLFSGGQRGEERIEVVSKLILDALQKELTFPDLKVKASIFHWMSSKYFPEVFHYALNDPSINLDQDTKNTFKRLFSGRALREESLKRFLYDITLSPEDANTIFDGLNFVDINLIPNINMVNGHEQRPGLKEETIAHTSKLVTTLVNAYRKTLNEKVGK